MRPRSPGQRVAVAGSPADAALTRQLRVELAVLGFEAVVLETTPISTPKRSATAHAHAEPRGHHSHLVRRAARGSVRRRHRYGGISTRGMNPTRGDATPRVLALRAVELLRASLRELDTRRQPTPDPPSALPLASAWPSEDTGALPPIALPSPAPRLPRWVVGVSEPQRSQDPGGIGPSLAATPTLKAWLHDNWGASVLGLVPLMSPHVAGAEGTATAALFLFGAGPSFRVRSRAGWELEGSIGMGGALLRTTGSAGARFAGQVDVATSAAAYASASAAYWLTGDLALGGGLLLGALASPLEMRFANHPTAKWGVPYGAGSISLSLRID